MQTNAERQFNDDYQVLRHLYFTCKVKHSKKMILLWIQQKGLETAVAAEKEINSDNIRKLFHNQSQYEKDSMKFFGEE